MCETAERHRGMKKGGGNGCKMRKIKKKRENEMEEEKFTWQRECNLAKMAESMKENSWRENLGR